MHKLELTDSNSLDRLETPTMSPMIDLDTSALAVFTDFQQVAPVTIDPGASVDRVRSLMLAAHVRLILVVDDDDRFLGAIGLDDISQQQVICEVSRGYRREELVARDFMRPRSTLRSIDYRELAQANISDVVAALEDSGERHCLVLDQQAGRIRGIISASDVARTLRVPVRLDKAPSFAQIVDALHHQLNEPLPTVYFA